jgi:hypothetical protein
MMKRKLLTAAITTLALASGSLQAAVSADEAARLGKDLTPVGAERAGNADGSIPEWTGGLTSALPNWPNENSDRPNPHADDAVQFTITAANMEQYADKLTEGTKAMLKAYPDFKVNVYPSRRTAAFPQSIYDAIAANAVKAELTNGGDAVANVWGSIPFPIPQTGVEVIWNHLLRYQGFSREFEGNENVIFNNGQRQDWFFNSQGVSPFYMADASDKDKSEGLFLKMAITYTKPSRDSGEGYLAMDSLDMSGKPRKAWTYDPGERRVRRAPNLSFDTPDRALNVIDDYEVFSGSPERYDWKLVGKQEMYVPYNNNLVNSPALALDEIAGDDYLNADKIRYELHRVWVVEGTVKEGMRHLYQKRVQYVDEDTWNILATDKYDGNGDLWRISYSYPVVASEVPLTGAGAYTSVDLKKNGYYIMNLAAGGKGYSFNVDPKPDSYFTRAAVRRRGRRGR